MSAGENISVTAGDNISTSAGQDHMVLAENITMIANDTISKDASRIEKTADHVEINALKDDIELHSSKQIINKSGSNVKLF